MSINNISCQSTKIVNFHLVLPKKKLNLIKRIAKKQNISQSCLIRKIFSQYRLVLQNSILCKSPKKSKNRLKIKNKVETRFNISLQDYDFLTQNQLLNNYSSRAEFFREIIFDYLDQLLDCGNDWFNEKKQKIKSVINKKLMILKKIVALSINMKINFSICTICEQMERQYLRLSLLVSHNVHMDIALNFLQKKGTSHKCSFYIISLK